MQYCGEKAVVEMPEEFIGKMVREFGFKEDFVRSIITPFMSKTLSYFKSTFLDLSKGGQPKAIEFEKAVCNLFNDRLLFKARLTGQLKRPSGVGGYSDIFIIALDNEHCALIEVKATPYYSLPSDDFEKMAGNYIPNYHELTDKCPLKLEFCVYVAGGYTGGVKKKLAELKKRTKVDVSAISALELLAVSNRKISEPEQVKIREAFKKNNLLSAADFN